MSTILGAATALLPFFGFAGGGQARKPAPAAFSEPARPSVCRIVLFTDAVGGEMPAIVTAICGDPADMRVSLTAFSPESIDECVERYEDVRYDASGADGTWRWQARS